MDKIRMGIIGIGNMGSGHAKNIVEGKCPEIELAAVCDINPDRLQWAQENLPATVERFDDAIKMMESGKIDAVIVSIPHYFHPQYAIEGFKHHLHVMCEKPAGVYTKQVREMNEAAAKADVTFAMMFNQRTNCVYRKMKEIVESGEMGALRRANWIITNWYRPQAYYDSGAWRATWSGEGGGVLLNQCPHNLDLWQWIFGMPKSIRAKCAVGKYHDIEVEDDVTITADYENGATACFITTTGEFPGTNRLEITGDRGKIVVEGRTMTVIRLEKPEREVSATAKESFAFIPFNKEEVEIDGRSTAHVGIMQNFTNCILHGEPLLSPGYEGINELTISNAAYLSDWTGKEITLPMDEELFYQMLMERVKTSKVKTNVAPSKIEDLSGTYSARWHGNK